MGERFDESTTSHHTLEGARPGRRLLVVWDGGMTQHDLPERGRVVLGRGQECDIRIDHTSVSRKHAVLHVGDAFAIEDLGSSNGTRIDGKEVASGATVRLAPGQRVRLGATTLILPAAASAAVSPSSPPAMMSPAMHALYETVGLVAKGKIPVLVVGETGVGKELVAREIHRLSPRAGGPFVSLSCAAIPETMIESELFGFERDAFPGALAGQPKIGLVEAASGGTLLLDEVAELPLSTQAKLLRVLESGEVQRLGSLEPKRVDVRFVAATNRELEELVQTGGFRADLFYRLNGTKLVVPPLRERRGEIARLAQALASAASTELGQPPVGISTPVLALLERYDWPGNVRELKNLIERAVLVARGATIGVEHLPRLLGPTAPISASAPTLPPSAFPSTGDLRTDLGAIERERIRQALAECDNNQSRAAKMLGISRRTLINRLDEYQLPRPRKKGPNNEEE